MYMNTTTHVVHDMMGPGSQGRVRVRVRKYTVDVGDGRTENAENQQRRIQFNECERPSRILVGGCDGLVCTYFTVGGLVLLVYIRNHFK